MTTATTPASTPSCPSWIWTAVTEPALGASCATSVFITSRMNSTSPAATLSPFLTRTFQTFPGTWVTTSSAMIIPSNDAFLGAQRVDLAPQRLRLIDAHRLEAQHLRGLGLAELPKGRRRHGIGIDETARARSVVHQDDRRLPGEVDGTHGVTLVDDV